MFPRRVLSFVLLFLLAVFLTGPLVSGRGQSGAGGGKPVPAVMVAGEPTGASRCKVCHLSEVEGYSRSAMAHSLRRAGHEPSGAVHAPTTKITMYSDAAGSWQRLESAGSISRYRIDYVIGSGNHASGYLIDIAGHLFQSPVAFYKSRKVYDLAPGYEKTAEPDFTRPVAEGCVFCHAGTELHVSGTENEYRSPVFPEEAITCERCHGPSEKHLADPRAGTIVNPAKLERGARDSICEQCHLMGVARVPNPGREFRDFQPGQRLESTFTTYHEALPPNSTPAEFKVISHVEQLALSACARNSQGRLWCGTCHDPHSQPAEPVAYYRARCLTCHTTAFASPHPGAESNCIGCHMPRRSAQDGGHTAFTDHRIQRRPAPQTDLPSAADIAAWREPAPELQKRNLGIAWISAGLQRRSPDLIVRGYRLLTEVQNQFSYDPELFTWIGTALLVGKKSSEAELAFERVQQLNPDSAAAETNMAAALQQAGDIAGAMTHLQRAVAIDPIHLSATSSLIDLYQKQGNAGAANQLSDRVQQIMEERPGADHPKTQNMQAPAKTAEAVFKNIKALKGVPADEIIPGMRFMASSLGVQCSFCHVEGHFEDDAKKPKEVARGMMRMMASINRSNFGGSREVTCYSCHRGSLKPVDSPAVVTEGPPASDFAETAGMKEEFPEALPTSEELIDRYVQALGGASALQKITTRVETGRIQAGGNSTPIEIFTQGPDKRSLIAHTSGGDSVTTLNGEAGWVKTPGRPTHDLRGADLDAAKVDADLQFALHLQQKFPELRVEYTEMIKQRKAYVMTGLKPGEPAWQFFFDAQSGLLVRLVRHDESPLGLDSTAIDYGDYRAVDGVEIPFRRTVIQAGSRMTVEVKEVQQNIPIDEGRFAGPSATTAKGH